MKLYRVTNEKYANVFNGTGASFDDGARWNKSGTPVMYFATNMATALVEAANYHPSPRLMPKTHCKAVYELTCDVSIKNFDANNLPSDWQDMPYPVSTQEIGTQFCQDNEALILLLTSVAVGVQSLDVALVNPLHPDINKLKLVETIKPVYSMRMFSGA